MKITPIRTGKIVPYTQTLTQILDTYVPPMQEGSVLAITSKIVAICEGRVVKSEEGDKKALIEAEADQYLEPNLEAKYKINITIKNNILIASAGIDESNGSGYYILWPHDPQATANKVRAYLKKRFSLKDIGVIITDSKNNPLRRGTVGVGLAHSGFKALKNYIGKPDIFGRNLVVTNASIMEGLAGAAVVTMGEGNEQTPLALIEQIPFVEFQKKNPSKAELENLRIELEDDLYAQFLNAVTWKKGKGGKEGIKK